MDIKPGLRLLLTALMGACIVGPAQAAKDSSDNEALWSAIQSLEQKVEATASAIDGSGSTTHGHGGSGKTTIGGYGEMHYNNLDSKTEMDFHRAVLFVGHEFSDSIRFFTEWDLEHSFTMELEQAYLEFDLNEQQRLSAGVLLMPIGIINETHEPPTFYGVDRNPVENKIIPTTWREGGVGLAGNMANGLSYDLLLTTGLDATEVDDNKTYVTGDDVKSSSYSIRSGRQHVAKAKAEDLATTARLKWTGMPGVEIAASVQWQDNITQGVDPDAAAMLVETHAVINHGPLTVKALYASWAIDGAGAKAVGKDEQSGWYIEPSYKLGSQWGVFARYNSWDNSAGAGSGIETEYTQAEVGANFWPHENVVVKVDVMQQDKAGVRSDEGFNIGVGYYF